MLWNPRLLLNKFSVFLCWIFFSLSLDSSAQNSVRTPARRMGAAYSVKIKLVKNEFDWVVPVWVKPDQKESTLDPGLMRLLGWPNVPFEFDEVSMSGHRLQIKRLGTQKSDWYASTEFTKNCCAGVLGQDVLSQFVVRFSPKDPVHLIWTHVAEADRTPKMISDQLLKGLFQVGSSKIGSRDFSKTPYVLDFRKKEILFE